MDVEEMTSSKTLSSINKCKPKILSKTRPDYFFDLKGYAIEILLMIYLTIGLFFEKEKVCY